jgi:serine-type D-Ala-D-Ala carboxypeptidase/endopeptidase (penicillin-binding protein 4)
LNDTEAPYPETILNRTAPAWPAAALFLLFGATPAGDVPPTGGEYFPDVGQAALSDAAATPRGAPPPPEVGLERAFLNPTPFVELRSEVDRLIRGTAWAAGDWGILAVSLATGDTLLAVDPDRPLAPASNLKLVTSAAALHHLGPDFRFTTYLLARGPIRGEALHGDLILYGTGDPTFADTPLRGAQAAFPRFLEELRALGIREIRGDILGDETYFKGPYRRDGWNPANLNDWYAARASALSFNENVATIRVQPGPAGTAPRVITIPESANLPMENQSLSVATRPRTPFMAIRDDPDTPIILWGQLPEGSREVWRVITVSDPPAYAASVLQHYLESEGIRVHGGSGAIRDPVDSPLRGAGGPTPLRSVAVHRSPPLRDMLRAVNVESHNLFAELLTFTLGRVVHGEASFAAGTAVLQDYLVDILGVDGAGLRLDDGSGLSRHNRLTAGSLVRVLEEMAGSDLAEGPFWTSLPRAGDRRELARMYRSPAAGNLRAKTGTIQRVSSLSGLVHTADGEPVVFSILANDVPTSTAKRIEDQIGIHLAAFTRDASETSRPPTGDRGPVSATR